MMVQENPIESE